MRWATSSYDYYQSVTVLQNHLLSWSTLQQLRLYSKLLLFHKTINNLVTTYTLTIQSYYLAFNHADDSMPGYALYLHSQLQPLINKLFILEQTYPTRSNILQPVFI